MTAELFAELVNARHSGVGKWQACCPAHEDRHPSLSITQGHSGVLLKCRSAGCSIESIMAALHLPTSALFDGPQLTPEERANAAQQRTIRDAEQTRQRAIDREKRDRIFKLENLRDAIGAKLARNPDDRELGRLFHLACERLHEAESAMPCHEDGPLRLPEPSAIPGWIHDALVELGASFAPEPSLEHDPAAVTFAELSAWLQLQKETERSEQAAWG